ncbi:MAG: hypothetical protein KDD63_29255 [Bacteroidetes bacterium]|nr:hypothetical protein [Bacteroidota bacterium]
MEKNVNMKPYIANKPHPDNSYTKNLIAFLDRYGQGDKLLEDLTLIAQLPENKANEIVSYFLELACQAQAASNINNGRYCLQNLPREWLMQRIEILLEPLLALDDEWEYWRLELYSSLDDKTLAVKLANRANVHPDPAIKEAGGDFLEYLG